MTKALRSIALLAVLAVSATPAFASEEMYSEGGYTVAARAGVAPSALKKKAVEGKGVFSGTNPSRNFVVEAESRSFNKLYKLPFAAGFDLGYFMQDGLEVFANFDFAVAKAKHKTATLKFRGQDITFPTAVSKNYRSFGGYFGARSYFCTADCLVPFVGAKIGAVKFDQGKAGFSAGIQLGVDYKIAENTALTFMTEAVATTSKKRFDHKAKVGTATKPVPHTHVAAVVGGRTQYSFPITLGVKFRF